MGPSQPDGLEYRAPPSPNRIWLHFTGLLTLGVVIAFLDGLVTVQGATFGTAVRAIPEALYVLMPVVAAVSVGLGFGVGRSAALRIVIASTVLMVGLDLLPPSGQERVVPQASINAAGRVDAQTLGVSTWRAAGAIRTTVAVLRGELPNIDEQLTSFPPEHDRVRATSAIIKLGLLFAPIIAVGVVLGLSTWIDKRVVFRSGRDEIAAMLVIAWGGGPFVIWAVAMMSANAQASSLLGSSSIWLILLPYLPLGAISAMGWRTFLRSAPAD